MLARAGIPLAESAQMTEETLLATLDILIELTGRRQGGDPDPDGKVHHRYTTTRRNRNPPAATAPGAGD